MYVCMYVSYGMHHACMYACKHIKENTCILTHKAHMTGGYPQMPPRDGIWAARSRQHHPPQRRAPIRGPAAQH